MPHGLTCATRDEIWVSEFQAKTEYDRKQGSEGCLYLNVYKPRPPTRAPRFP